MQKRIPDIARQAIVNKLIDIGQIKGENGSYSVFFERVYPECKSIKVNKKTLAEEIYIHCDYNEQDWGDDASIFSTVKILEWTDKQFFFFCTEYVHPIFNRYE